MMIAKGLLKRLKLWQKQDSLLQNLEDQAVAKGMEAINGHTSAENGNQRHCQTTV